MELSLDRIAATLEGLEETIISKLIDRAQFRVNRPAYTPGRSGFTGEGERSLFELRLRYTEKMDAQFGRFCVPEERPFTRRLPRSRREVNLPPTGLHLPAFDAVSVAPAVQTTYLEFVPRFCAAGDDGQYGSSVEHDVFALQALSRRIHYGGLYVAESKYRDDPAGYAALVAADDTAGMLAKLTRHEVEERIVQRVRSKVEQLQKHVNRRVRTCIDPDVLVTFYRDHVIPLTKRSEVLYLRHREPQVPRRKGGA